MRNVEDRARPQQRSHDGMLGVCMDTTSRISEVKRIPEERGARRFLEIQRGPSEKDTVGVWGRVGLWIWENEDMRRFDALFLHSRRRYKDFVA